MELKFLSNEVLENKSLQELLVNLSAKISFIKWNDGSYTEGLGKDKVIEYVNDELCFTEELWVEPVVKNVIFGLKIYDIELNKIFTTYEVANLFRKDEKSIRYYIKNGQLERFKDYRKAGRINFVNLNSMERIYGELFRVRLNDLAGLKWKYLSNDEKEFLLSSAKIYKENSSTDECIVDFENSNLSIKGLTNSNNDVIVNDSTELELSEIRKFKLYYISVNIDNWDYFDKVDKVGYVNNFFYVNGMKKGDKAIFHISKNEEKGVHGVYAWGTIVGEPKVVDDKNNYCYGKKAIDIRFDKFSKDKPLMTFDELSEYVNNFFGNKIISQEYQYEIVKKLDIK